MKNFLIYQLTLAASILGAHSVCAGSRAPVACAIRWDAWYTNGPNEPAHFTAMTLSKPKWHGLAPLHGKFDAAGNVSWAPTQETVDAEIRAAHGANLCWAYLVYGDQNKPDLNDSMMMAFAFHRNSKIKNDVKYALMTATNHIGLQNNFKDAVDLTVQLMADPDYQRIEKSGESRPVLFIYYSEDDVKVRFGGSLPKMKEPIDAIRKQSIETGIGNPYIVVVEQPAAAAESARSALGGDAVSEYISGNRVEPVEQWPKYETTIEADWDRYASPTAGDVVPTLRSGDDARARCETPPPWVKIPAGDKCNDLVVSPTVNQLKTEFENAVSWIQIHPGKAPAGLLLVYAWSECDESGNCLMPTYADPKGEKLKAISEPLSRRIKLSD